MLAAAYLALARGALSLAYVQGIVSPFWPASGLALAAVLLVGPRAWPGIAIGGFLAPMDTAVGPAGALLIAVGNTLEPLLGSWLLRRRGIGTDVLGETEKVFRFFLYGALIAPVASATCGAAAVVAHLPAQWPHLAPVWVTWYLADTMGIMLLAPVLLALMRPAPFAEVRARPLEACLMFAAVLGMGALVFGLGAPPASSLLPFPWLSVPALFWAAFRFGPAGATLAGAALTVMAATLTMQGHGPLARPDIQLTAVVMQVFVLVVNATIMIVAALLAEREAARTELERRNQELEAANEGLTQLALLKSHYVGIVSHELRSPLTTVMGYAEFLEDQIGGPLTPEQADYVHHIQKNTRRLRRLVDDLLDFALLDTGIQRLERDTGELARVVRQVADEARPLIEERGLRLALVLPEAPVTLQLDGDRIEQVLVNLLDNAVRHTPQGGTITLGLAVEGDAARVSVADTGTGMAPEALPRVFEKYFRTEEGRRRARRGAGLGLAICKALVEAHGGTIGVESRPGAGTTFWFTLPLAPAVVSEPA